MAWIFSNQVWGQRVRERESPNRLFLFPDHVVPGRRVVDLIDWVHCHLHAAASEILQAQLGSGSFPKASQVGVVTKPTRFRGKWSCEKKSYSLS